jgi:hypothetical protein
MYKNVYIKIYMQNVQINKKGNWSSSVSSVKFITKLCKNTKANGPLGLAMKLKLTSNRETERFVDNKK